ncbi:unnamed protein product [Lactuca saligna]|uniref:5'-nucleotidase n=1 Tax=Lactuca saligna TaxID=75948 RepID=A0AA35YZC7_LACSI|nr:unnamed protein product [Lactuca saligna]
MELYQRHNYRALMEVKNVKVHVYRHLLMEAKRLKLANIFFCNKAVNMKNIVAVGFDMDYTLAQYNPKTFESLAYNGTVKKLVTNLGYTNELLDWSFDWTYMVRGLVFVKKRGNILKMDSHKYVKVAYQRFRLLLKDKKVATYGNTLVCDAFDEPDYALIDTIFSLAEAYLFAQLVDFKGVSCGNWNSRFHSIVCLVAK